MAKKIQQNIPTVAKLNISKSEFERELKECIERAQLILDMKVTPLSSPSYLMYGYSRSQHQISYNEAEYGKFKKEKNEWVDYVSEMLRQYFDIPNNEYETDFNNRGQLWGVTGNEDWVKEYKEEIKAKRDFLESMVKKLKFIPTLSMETSPEQHPAKSVNDTDTNNGNKTDIFIVHGHDTAMKLEVARVLEKLGLHPIILHEQPNKGRTIIEKLEEASQTAGFAVILLTADDLGKAKKEEDKDFQPRARQNVVFEMGYFIGKLGRSRVMSLLEAGVEKPGDLDGIVYTPIDKGGNWRYELVSELQNASYQVSKDSIP